uniref:Uncharacterized protein n=1 Tax=Myoviridae sp. ctijX18 TaxID=2825154 RepID=A0A8S5USP4_9CAUD|nr:MAG TPA: hypothetical protein [Myoviridae sp. ctijX18]DAQ61270.1 MAG TPA: hypothetical protein [Caudoviricetes sp.]
MFKTISDFPKYTHAELFRLNPINQFLIKKYPREEDNSFLARYWQAYLFAVHVLKDKVQANKSSSIVVTPEEFYKVPNLSISSCFNEWLEMFKKDRVFKSTFNMDSIPGVSEPISIEIEGIPEDTAIAFTGFLDKIKTNGMIDQKDIEKEIEDGSNAIKNGGTY